MEAQHARRPVAKVPDPGEEVNGDHLAVEPEAAMTAGATIRPPLPALLVRQNLHLGEEPLPVRGPNVLSL